VVLTGTAAQTVTGNSLNDVITSNDYGSAITGGSGNDTFIAGHGADILTAGSGDNTFEFNYLPWNAGQITDFNVNTDVLDLNGLFTAAGYHGTNPVADGYLSFTADATGEDTQVYFDPNGLATTIPILITTLDHVAPGSLLATDWTFQAPATQTAAATYTLPSNVQDVQLTGTAAQTVTGNSLVDVIISNDDGSTIIGGTGNDTLVAGQGADMLTGGGGSDTFVFDYLPWNAGHITDFNVNTDVLDLRGLFNAACYHGTNPVADGYLSFAADSTGEDTKIYFDPQGPSTTIPILITTLDHVAPGSLQASDWIYH